MCLSLSSACNHQGAPATCHACTRARTSTEEAPPALSPRTPAQPALDPSPSQLVAPRTHLCTVYTSHAARKRCVRSTQGRPTPTRPRLSPRPGSLLGRRGHKRHNQAREREEEGFCLQQVTRTRDPSQSSVSPNSKPGEGFTRGANAHRGACAQGLRHGTARHGGKSPEATESGPGSRGRPEAAPPGPGCPGGLRSCRGRPGGRVRPDFTSKPALGVAPPMSRPSCD